jgi:hypothetical protein
MSDLKTNWTNPPVPTPGLGGASVVSSGGDPNFPDGPPETANSVSGLPPLPNRFEPSGSPPAPPSLQDRNPGTIDQR